MSVRSPKTVAVGLLKRAGVDVGRLHHPKAVVAERLGSVFRAELLTLCLWGAAAFTVTNVSVPEVVESAVVVGGLGAWAVFFATGQPAARRAVEDTTPYSPTKPEPREVSGEVTTVIEPQRVACHGDPDTRRRSYGHCVAIVEEPCTDPTGFDRVRATVPGLSATERTPVLIDPDTDVEAGDNYEGVVQPAIVQKEVDATVPVESGGGKP